MFFLKRKSKSSTSKQTSTRRKATAELRSLDGALREAEDAALGMAAAENSVSETQVRQSQARKSKPHNAQPHNAQPQNAQAQNAQAHQSGIEQVAEPFVVTANRALRREPAEIRPLVPDAGAGEPDSPGAPRINRAKADTDDDAAIPSFRMPAASISIGRDRQGQAVSIDSLRRLRGAFTPSHPKRSSRLFSGRFEELKRVISAIEEERAHVIIYAERGRGKTSIANVISEIGENAGYLVLRYSCNSSVTFEEIFRSLLAGIPQSTIGVGASEEDLSARTYEALLPEGDFGATELTQALRQLRNLHVIFLIDEFDRIQSDDLKNQIAETIKNLSDISASVTFVILGVAHNLEELLGKHPSIQRNVVGVLLPSMKGPDIKRLILAGAEAASMDFTEDTCNTIVTLARGLPYYAQLLSLHGGRLALERGSETVEVDDIEGAIDRVLAESDRLVIEIYEQVTGGGRNQFQKDVLFAAAFCDADQYDTFTAIDAAKVFSGTSNEIHLLALQKALSVMTTDDKGPVLRKFPEPAGTRYGFFNQTMRQYILVRQARERGLFN